MYLPADTKSSRSTARMNALIVPRGVVRPSGSSACSGCGAFELSRPGIWAAAECASAPRSTTVNTDRPSRVSNFMGWPSCELSVRRTVLCTGSQADGGSPCIDVSCRSELELNPGLEELRRALQAEPVERAIAIGDLEPCVVGEVPVHHRRDSPELATLDGAVGVVAIRVSQHRLPRSGPAVDDGLGRRDAAEVAADRVVRARFARDQPLDSDVATMKEWIARVSRIHRLDVVLRGKQPGAGPVIRLESHHLGMARRNLSGVQEVRGSGVFGTRA